jgi:Short C-terminal domain
LLRCGNFPGIPSDYEVIWQGIVRVDRSISEHASSVSIERDGFKLFAIKDSKYRYEDNAQFDNIDGLQDFPNNVLLLVKDGEILEYMNCLVIICYVFSESKGFFKKGTLGKKTIAKGFILQPVLSENMTNSCACLASIQFNNEQGRALTFQQQGLFAFASGSQTSKITIRDPRKSVTSVFVASDDKPFVAFVHSKDNKILKFTCDSKGIKLEEGILKENMHSSSLPSTKQDPIEILKVRLAKGEITIEEYQKVKKVIEDNHVDSVSRWM